MTFLLDTHSFLWFAADPDKLLPLARHTIEDVTHHKIVSIVSFWKIAIKHSLGKLSLELPLEQFVGLGLVSTGARVLPVELPHLVRLITLPFHHRDPFDRLLVAQCMVEGFTLLSNDEALDAYGVSRRWA